MSIQSPIFAPAIVLVLWSLVMLAWLVLTRVPAMAKAGVDLANVVGGRGVNLEGVIPDRVNWKAHNYAHLMEQPTLFYATVVILGVVGAGDGLNLQLAWAYVGLRIAHSVVQATWNRVAVRFALFGLATAALLVLAINAARATL
ncbi:MAG TPA: MAPEG family protein [Steroidobacteraceae bacterium]|nr:MAPEG family protein [Steroidobacteraceae bacterium]